MTEQLKIVISAVDNGATKTVNSIKQSMGDINNFTGSGAVKGLKNIENATNRTTKAANLMGKAFKAAVAFLTIKGIIGFGTAAVAEATNVQTAWMGLRSIMEGTGGDFERAQSFIQNYISDGLIPLADATTAYKNLIARGFTASQAENTLNSLKDAAAFNRQASYSMGEAVRSATEGIKNENSVLVDNAGVTKNVAKMWEEYAKSIGKTRNELTQAEKVQAEYLGIQKETAFQTGDAAKLVNTFQGALDGLNNQWRTFQANLGAIIQTGLWPFIQVISTAVKWINAFVVAIAQLAGMFGKTNDASAQTAKNAKKIASGIGDVGDAAKKANKNLAKFDELQVMSSPTSASSGGGAGIELPEPEATTGAYVDMSAQVQELADKIKAAIGPGTVFWELLGLIKAVMELIVAVGIRMVELVLNPIQNFFKETATGQAMAGVLHDWAKAIEEIARNPEKVDAIAKALLGVGIAIATIKVTADIIRLMDLFGAFGTVGASGLKGITGGFKDFQVALAGTATVLKKSGIGTQIASIFGGFQKGVPLTKSLGQAFGALKAVFAAHPFVAIGIAIAGLLLTNEDFRKSLMELVGTIASALMPILQTLAGVVLTLWEAIKPLVDIIFTVIDILITILVPIFDVIFSVIGSIIEILAPIIALVIQFTVAINPLFIGLKLVAGILNLILEPLKQFAQWLKDLLAPTGAVGEKLEWLRDTMKNVVDGIVGFLGDLFDKFRGIFGDIVKVIKDVFVWYIKTYIDSVIDMFKGLWTSVSNIFGNIKGIFIGIIDFIKNVFTGNWKGAFQGLVDIVSNVFGGIVNIIKMPINVIIDLINGFIKGLNKIKVPDWVPGVGGKGINIPLIPKLAKGGIVDEGQIFIAGENGKEVVMPLENNTGWMDIVANKISAGINSGGQNKTIQMNVDGRRFAEVALDTLNAFADTNGFLPLQIA